MRLGWCVTALWACGSPALAAALGPPLAAAADGQIQCYAPDAARMTCQSLAAYKARPDGGIDNTALVLISQDPPMTMRTVSQVEIKAGQVCGAIRPEDIAAATFTISEAPADEAQTVRLRETMQAAMSGLFGREICTAYIPDGPAAIAKATVNGAEAPTMDQKVIWVSPTAGYRVAP